MAEEGVVSKTLYQVTITQVYVQEVLAPDGKQAERLVTSFRENLEGAKVRSVACEMREEARVKEDFKRKSVYGWELLSEYTVTRPDRPAPHTRCVYSMYFPGGGHVWVDMPRERCRVAEIQLEIGGRSWRWSVDMKMADSRSRLLSCVESSVRDRLRRRAAEAQAMLEVFDKATSGGDDD